MELNAAGESLRSLQERFTPNRTGSIAGSAG